MSFPARLLLLCCLTLASTTVARSELPSDALDRLDAAVARFDSLAKETRTKGRLPRLSAPDERPILEAMFDPAVLGRPPYTRADLATLDALDKQAASITSTYRRGEPPIEDWRAPSTRRQAYTDEILRSDALVYQITVDKLIAMADLWTHLAPDETRSDVERKVRHLRDEIEQPALSDPRVLLFSWSSAEVRMVWAELLARNAVALADAFPPGMRRSYRVMGEETLAKAPEAMRPKLEIFVAAMSARECTGLCRVPQR